MILSQTDEAQKNNTPRGRCTKMKCFLSQKWFRFWMSCTDRHWTAGVTKHQPDIFNNLFIICCQLILLWCKRLSSVYRQVFMSHLLKQLLRTPTLTWARRNMMSSVKLHLLIIHVHPPFPGCGHLFHSLIIHTLSKINISLFFNPLVFFIFLTGGFFVQANQYSHFRLWG